MYSKLRITWALVEACYSKSLSFILYILPKVMTSFTEFEVIIYGKMIPGSKYN